MCLAVAWFSSSERGGGDLSQILFSGLGTSDKVWSDVQTPEHLWAALIF